MTDAFIQDVPQPGSIFWEEVTHPENIQLLEGDESARKLPSDKLKALKRRLQQVKRSLHRFEYRLYRTRLQRLNRKETELLDALQRTGNPAPLMVQLEKIRSLRDELEPVPAPAEGVLTRFFRKTDKTYELKTREEVRRARILKHRLEQRLQEHQIALANEALYRQLQDEMKGEIKYLSDQIVERWTSLGYREEYWDKKGKRHLRKVQIEEAYFTEDEIQFKIYVSHLTVLGSTVHHLPDQVRAWDLVKGETLRELTAACERKVTSPHVDEDYGFENGAWVVVNRLHMNNGLFEYIELNQILRKYNQSKRHKFPFPVGVKRGRVIVWLNLTEEPHLAFNGITGSGKSNVARVALATWSQFHSPAEIQFIVADLKRLGDFKKFESIPHLMMPIIKDVKGLADIMPRLVAEMYHRADVMEGIAYNIDEYNAAVEPDERLPRIVVLIDEVGSISDLASNSAQENLIIRCMTLIAAQARAAGIHLMLGTQQPSKEAIPTRITNNITATLSGRQKTLSGAMMALGNSKAKDLPAIRGRMIYDAGFDLIEVQTPYATPEDIQAAVNVAQQYEAYPLELPEYTGQVDDLETPEMPVTEDEVIQIAIEQFEGSMNYLKIYDVTGGRSSQNKIKQMIQHVAERDRIDFNGTQYEPVRYGRGYRLVISESVNQDIDHIADSTADSHADTLREGTYA